MSLQRRNWQLTGAERHKRDGGQRDVAEVGKNWWGGAKYMAKKEVEVCKLEEPLICQQFPCPEPGRKEEAKRNAKVLGVGN